MNVFQRPQLVKPSPDHVRTHPWSECSRGKGRYCDFKAHPELISQTLEDFIPFADWLGVQRFYKMLAWANGPTSQLETNDCALRGPHANTDSPQFRETTESSFRLMFFYRHLINNVRRKRVKWLVDRVTEQLSQVVIEPVPHCLEVALIESAYTTLRYLSEEEQVGWEIDLTGWVFGNSTDETMVALDAVVDGLDQGLRQVSAAIERY